MEYVFRGQGLSMLLTGQTEEQRGFAWGLSTQTCIEQDKPAAHVRASSDEERACITNQLPRLCAHGSAASSGIAGVPSSWRVRWSRAGLTWRRMLLTKARVSNGLMM